MQALRKAEKDLSILVIITTLNKVQRTLGCINKSISCRSREGILLLYYALVRLYPSPMFNFRLPSTQNDSTRWTTTMKVRGLKHTVYEDRLGELDVSSLQKRRLTGDLTTTFDYLKENYREGRGTDFSKKHNKRIKLRTGGLYNKKEARCTSGPDCK